MTNRHDTIRILTDLIDRSPDVRMGQLLAHLGFLGEDEFDKSLSEINDDELLSVCQRHHDELLNRINPVSSLNSGLVLPELLPV